MVASQNFVLFVQKAKENFFKFTYKICTPHYKFTIDSIHEVNKVKKIEIPTKNRLENDVYFFLRHFVQRKQLDIYGLFENPLANQSE